TTRPARPVRLSRQRPAGPDTEEPDPALNRPARNPGVIEFLESKRRRHADRGSPGLDDALPAGRTAAGRHRRRTGGLPARQPDLLVPVAEGPGADAGAGALPGAGPDRDGRL